MPPTVDDLRNDIRVAVGRYERVESTQFTKEALAAICETVDADIEHERRPGKGEMRTAIRKTVPELYEGIDASRAFRKGELEAIAAVVRD